MVDTSWTGEDMDFAPRFAVACINQRTDVHGCTAATSLSSITSCPMPCVSIGASLRNLVQRCPMGEFLAKGAFDQIWSGMIVIGCHWHLFCHANISTVAEDALIYPKLDTQPCYGHGLSTTLHLRSVPSQVRPPCRGGQMR
jgi:hypothetical protein